MNQFSDSKKSKTKSKIWVVEDRQIKSHGDYITTEEPLEIRLVNPQQTLAITMRTPGTDFDLVAGFLYAEGIITKREDIETMRYCVDSKIDETQQNNIINVQLKQELKVNIPSLERHFFTNSACGVCGKASIEAIKLSNKLTIPHHQLITPEILYSLPDKLQSAQGLFSLTGGLHAAALFDLQGQRLKLREDVGRHNALDKLIGSALLADELPLHEHIILVSGRSSFEILQKCIMAGVPIVCSVSAPSSLAVSLAQEFGITLIGFLRGKRFNIYSGKERINFETK